MDAENAHQGFREMVRVSKARYIWWSYAKGMIRNYPALKAEHNALRSQSVTASYSGMPMGGGGDSRPVECAIGKGLSGAALREYEAVAQAIEETERYHNGLDRLAVIDMVLWKRSHTLEGAALMIPCSSATACRWHGEFIKLVAQNRGIFER